MTAQPIGRQEAANRASRRHVLALIDAAWTTQAIATAVHLDLPRWLASRPRSTAELAQLTGCHAASLRRLVQALVCLGLIEQDTLGLCALSASGQWLRSDLPEAESLADWAALSGERLWRYWGQLAQCVRTGRSARFELSGQDGFLHLEHDAGAARQFHRAMANLTGVVADALVASAVLGGAGWLVDIGGGGGELAVRVCHAMPDLRVSVLDLAHAQTAAQQRFGAAGLADRCDFVAGDMFAAVPSGADAYLLKSILHDWDDVRCEALLRTCRAHMATHSRVLIVERVAGTADAPGKAAAVARSDLQMLVATGGRERSAAEYAALLHAAGLTLRSVTAVPGCDFSCIAAAA